MPKNSQPSLDEAPNGELRDEDDRKRFEQNRELSRDYERRPAIENLTNPSLHVTTRGQDDSAALTGFGPAVWMIVGAVLAGCLVGMGVLIGAGLTADGSSDSVGVDGPDETVRQSSLSTTIPPLSGQADAPAVAEQFPTPEPESTQTEALPSAVAVPSDLEVLKENIASVDLEQLSFVRGTAVLTTRGQLALGSLAEAVQLAPAEPVEILVHAFSESTPGENHGLSVQQARTIVDALVQNGVNNDRVLAVGLGSSTIEPPTVAGALFLSSDDEVLDSRLADAGPMVFEADLSEVESAESSEMLSSVAELLTSNSAASLRLVGYSWLEGSPDGDHEQSHHLLDAALAKLAGEGVARNRMSDVGLGRTPAPLAQLEGVVEVQTGQSASLAVALRNLDTNAIDFEAGSSALTSDGLEVLREVAQVLREQPAVRIELSAHTYSESTSQANHDLSESQGRAAIEALVTAGVPPERLELVWHGDPPHFATDDQSSVITFTVLR